MAMRMHLHEKHCYALYIALFLLNMITTCHGWRTSTMDYDLPIYRMSMDVKPQMAGERCPTLNSENPQWFIPVRDKPMLRQPHVPGPLSFHVRRPGVQPVLAVI